MNSISTNTQPITTANTKFVSTAIDYTNGPIHIGHAYEKVLADVYARATGSQLITGTDEHGQKVEQSAAKNAVTPYQWATKWSEFAQGVANKLQIGYSEFIRTTNPQHIAYVQNALQTLWDQKLIYKDSFSGWFSVGLEQFVKEGDKVDGEWPKHLGEVVWQEEEAYFFKLTAFKEWHSDFLKTVEVIPSHRLGQLNPELKDLCISRPLNRLSWGIPLPFDPNFVTYVWFDALLNYVSITHTTPELHVIGKDIVHPHLIYYPIILKALGLTIPTRFAVHGWLTIKGEKAAKSNGTATDFDGLIERYGVDGLRLLLAGACKFGEDADIESLDARYTTQCCNLIGNTLYRITKISSRPAYTHLAAPTVAFEATDYVNLDASEVIAKSLALCTEINKLLDTTKPWESDQVEAITTCLEKCARIVTQLKPICPNLTFPTTVIPFKALPKPPKLDLKT